MEKEVSATSTNKMKHVKETHDRVFTVYVLMQNTGRVHKAVYTQVGWKVRREYLHFPFNLWPHKRIFIYKSADTMLMQAEWYPNVSIDFRRRRGDLATGGQGSCQQIAVFLTPKIPHQSLSYFPEET